ncbi:hypothetical protein BpHYR1_044821 [Brachionus plicatilis]|uniref:Uncharacterized protein n=1 Tax=Brachionus plicatilis TaxID=10195 RepID=A0A3M7P8L8_BRAPC|nr:hypothetical protein BpHYR1_044821 [Brachionus plicatilis]
MEGIFRDWITDYVNKYSLIACRQHGFVQLEACETNLLELQEVGNVLTTKNPKNKYYIQHGKEKEWLQESEVEKDLGIMVSSDEKHSKQVEAMLYPAYAFKIRYGGFERVDLDIRENEGVSEGTIRRHNSQITREKQGGTMRDKFLLNGTATTWNLLPYQKAGNDTAN